SRDGRLRGGAATAGGRGIEAVEAGGRDRLWRRGESREEPRGRIRSAHREACRAGEYSLASRRHPEQPRERLPGQGRGEELAALDNQTKWPYHGTLPALRERGNYSCDGAPFQIAKRGRTMKALRMLAVLAVVVVATLAPTRTARSEPGGLHLNLTPFGGYWDWGKEIKFDKHAF